MKTIIKNTLKELIQNRYLLFLNVFNLILAIIMALLIGFSIRPSELKLLTHYTDFGITKIYPDHWYYLLTLPFFELIVAVLHSILSTKLLLSKGRYLAIMFAWLGVAIVIIGGVISLAIINAWRPR